MRSFRSLLAVAALASLPSAFATEVPPGIHQEIVPFSTLPACAQNCGPLFDVQGGCAPPAKSAVDNKCFCTDARLQPWLNSVTTGVCNDACPADPSGLRAMQSWYSTFCAQYQASPTTKTTDTATAKPTQTGANSGGANDGTPTGSTKPKSW
jgi:hypothetical protein